MSTEYTSDCSVQLRLQPPRGRGITKARDNLISYLLTIGEAGGTLPVGRSVNGVSLKDVAHRAGISVRSAQRMSPLIKRWASTLSSGTATAGGDMA